MTCDDCVLVAFVQVARKSIYFWVMRRIVPAIQFAALTPLFPVIRIISFGRQPDIQERSIAQIQPQFVRSYRRAADQLGADDNNPEFVGRYLRQRLKD
jgi:hypothetical protein